MNKRQIYKIYASGDYYCVYGSIDGTDDSGRVLYVTDDRVKAERYAELMNDDTCVAPEYAAEIDYFCNEPHVCEDCRRNYIEEVMK